MQSTLQALEPLQTQEYRNLKKYYHIAQSNQEIYSRLSMVYHLLYNEPYRLISSEKKQKQAENADFERARQKVKLPNKVLGEGIEYGKAA